MIVSVYKEDDKKFSFTTAGCGCCSESLTVDNQGREEIIKELKNNVKVLREACRALKIDYLEFVTTKK